MIAGITGKVLKKEPNWCDILTNGGVIYRVFISLNTFSALEPETTLLTSLIVREDAMLLFGFAKESERSLFEMLIKVSGVGPKSAMAILSTYTPDQFAEIIASANETRLTKVPGIGKKTAALLLVQLSGSIKTLGTRDSNDATVQATLALESLGFKTADILKALSKCTATDTAGLVKEALKYFQR